MQKILDYINYYSQSKPLDEAIITPSFTLNYNQLQAIIRCCYNELKGLSIKRLAIDLPNGFDWLVLDLAAALAEITVVPIPSFISKKKREFLLKDCSVDAIFCHQDNSLVGYYQSRSSFLNNRQYLLANNPKHSHLIKPNLCKITYSLSHQKILPVQEGLVSGLVSSLTGLLTSEKLKRHLCVLPFSFLLENIAGLYLSLAMGRSVVIDHPNHFGFRAACELNVTSFLKAITKYQAQSVILLPKMLTNLIDQTSAKALSGLKFIGLCKEDDLSMETVIRAKKMGLPIYTEIHLD